MEATPKSRTRGRRERRLPRAVTSATIELSDPNRPTPNCYELATRRTHQPFLVAGSSASRVFG
jgi:hypothetical protein